MTRDQSVGKGGWHEGEKKLLAAGLAISAIAAVVLTVVPASSQQPPARTTLSLFDPNKVDWDKDIDLGREGFSPGDMNIFVENALDPEGPRSTRTPRAK